jgi:beta-lactamase superfamily II metal-dependent hydrolase
MFACYLPDIGDGLVVGVKLLDGINLQVDCGSQQSSEEACKKGLCESLCKIYPDIFILSHFHRDHYNGFLYYYKRYCEQYFPCLLNIKKVFFPKIPDRKETRDFLKCLFALNARLGEWSGSMELDFLHLLSKINKSSFTFRAVSQGDLLPAGGSYIEILWPPKTIDDSTLKVIQKAIEDFEKARNKDEILNSIYERINQAEFVQKYFVQDETPIYEYENDSDAINLDDFEQFLERDIPECTKQANKSLRKAANHLSLAFRYNNQILFLGDLEANELKQISNYLLTKNQTHYLIIITPHHGTHWHDALKRLSAIYAISSVGKTLFPKIKSQFKEIADICLYTYANGEIEIPHPLLRTLCFWRCKYWTL